MDGPNNDGVSVVSKLVGVRKLMRINADPENAEMLGTRHRLNYVR